MDNNSGVSATLIDSMCGVWGYQKGQELALEYDSNLQKADTYTSVQSGYSLE